MPNSYDTSHPLDREGINASSSLFSSSNELTTENGELQFSIHSTSEIYANEIVDNGDISAAGYNRNSGYGLVDAGAAVGKAVGDNSFANVPSLGGKDWGADLVQAPEVWNKGYTGKGVIVAVLDTGVDYQHSDLNDNIWTNTKEIAGNGVDDDGNGYIDDVSGWNFHDDNNDILDRNGHGTHVSGTIAGENNDFGVTGIVYDAQIMPVKVLGDSGSGYYSSISSGIRYAVDNGADVINLSLGGRVPSNRIAESLEYANSKGVVAVMSAGNYSTSTPGYPGRYADKWGLVVGAVDRNNQMADFSNRAGRDNLAYVTAPGVKVYSTVLNNEYDSYSGTSMASPHVAGVVALMLSANPNLTPDRVRQIITETSDNNTQGTATNSWDFSSYLSANTINDGSDMTVSGHNLAFTDDLSNAQLWDYGQSVNQEPNVIGLFIYELMETSIQQFLFYGSDDNQDNNGNNGNINNDLASIVEDITRELQPYQRWLEFFFRALS
ncbi:MAG: S8 family serine peptidase [Richelia sp.]|nr:S8 family serine peptidase [Richelia sp.]